MAPLRRRVDELQAVVAERDATVEGLKLEQVARCDVMRRLESDLLVRGSLRLAGH